MNFLERIELFLISQDPIVQEFVLHALQEYPHVPEEWTQRLLEEALRSKEKEASILIYTDKHPIGEGAIKAILEGLKRRDRTKAQLYARLVSWSIDQGEHLSR